MQTSRLFLAGVILLLPIMAVGLSLRASKQAVGVADRYTAASSNLRKSVEDLAKAEDLAKTYVRTGHTDQRDQCKKLSNHGESELEQVHKATPEDGQIQSECREMLQSYELAGAQMVLAIEARQKSKIQRAAQFMSSSSLATANTDVRNSATTIDREIATDTEQFRGRAHKAVTAAVWCVGILCVAFGVFAGGQIRRRS